MRPSPKRSAPALFDSAGAEERPEQARIATNCLYLMEVFPALVLASDAQFFGRRESAQIQPAS